MICTKTYLSSDHKPYLLMLWNQMCCSPSFLSSMQPAVVSVPVIMINSSPINSVFNQETWCLLLKNKTSTVFCIWVDVFTFHSDISEIAFTAFQLIALYLYIIAFDKCIVFIYSLMLENGCIGMNISCCVLNPSSVCYLKIWVGFLSFEGN